MCRKPVIAELKTYFTEGRGSAKESVLYPLFFFIPLALTLSPSKRAPYNSILAKPYKVEKI